MSLWACEAACQMPDTAAPTCRELASLREVCEAGKREADKLQELLRYEEEKRVEAQGALEGQRGAREGDAAAFKQQAGPGSSWGCLGTGRAHCSLPSVTAGWAVNGLLCKSGLQWHCALLAGWGTLGMPGCSEMQVLDPCCRWLSGRLSKGV